MSSAVIDTEISSSGIPSSDSTQISGNPQVVSFSFYQVVPTRERNYPFNKTGKPFLELQVLGDRHTLTTVAGQLFKLHMEEALGESLYEHVWRFEPCENGYGKAFNNRVPILSSTQMGVKEQYQLDPDEDFSSDRCYLSEGSEMIFFYDEGSPTRIFVSISSVTQMPAEMEVQQYPRKNVSEAARAEASRKRSLIEAFPKLGSITMDEAYPFLRKRLLKERVKFDIGQGSCCFTDTWAHMWGGGVMPAYTSSLECLVPFKDLDEAFYSFDQGIKKQVSPGYPAYEEIEEVEKADGRIVKQKKQRPSDDLDFGVIVRPYPSSVNPSEYKSEYHKDSMFGCGDMDSWNSKVDPDRKVVGRWKRWAFNFALQPGSLEASKAEFSFTRQFPKCSKWLTHPSKISYWMFMENGVLNAVKGKSSKKGDNVVHQTLKHTTLHEMFADMECQIVLPKSWK